jgi:hypothetical protein
VEGGSGAPDTHISRRRCTIHNAVSTPFRTQFNAVSNAVLTPFNAVGAPCRPLQLLIPPTVSNIPKGAYCSPNFALILP